ncbi:aspartate aminotransferase [Alsobacter soli]|uniref:aspartate transaminase n=1 Tax=Alsobacter soli TaxID=2109933 RepID=A0A2T1HZ94_9HYPH|nr:pyridoxal phosphate-dependent aminotransferase [Alsobacter soli]PSC06799.1 aspartate aminotransferase [Alsobacter soli]
MNSFAVNSRPATDDQAASPEQALLSAVRPEAAGAPESGIVEVFNYGRGRQGLIPLWVGEGDMPTPSFIQDAATRSLAAGETFYTYQRGLPELRDAISRYMSRVYGQALPAERFFVTIGGMHALQMAIRVAAGAGDEVLIPSPAWPNFLGAVGIGGAVPVEVPMAVDPVRNRWSLDVERLAAAVTPRTKLIIVNSPANPTGWTATREELEAILALARRHGLWIIADEIYGRFVFDGSERAPSFHDIMAEDDRIIFVQTFSKNWAMTGWRIGWLECHPALGQVIENLMQYSCSGVPAFIQRAAIAALEQGEGFVQHQIERVRRGRDIICSGLAATGKVEFADPAGAFYLFFSIKGEQDTRRAALRLVDEANVGIAPGTAFGVGGERYFRLCFARRAEDIQEAARRLAAAV